MNRNLILRKKKQSTVIFLSFLFVFLTAQSVLFAETADHGSNQGDKYKAPPSSSYRGIFIPPFMHAFYKALYFVIQKNRPEEIQKTMNEYVQTPQNFSQTPKKPITQSNALVLFYLIAQRLEDTQAANFGIATTDPKKKEFITNWMRKILDVSPPLIALDTLLDVKNKLEQATIFPSLAKAIAAAIPTDREYIIKRLEKNPALKDPTTPKYKEEIAKYKEDCGKIAKIYQDTIDAINKISVNQTSAVEGKRTFLEELSRGRLHLTSLADNADRHYAALPSQSPSYWYDQLTKNGKNSAELISSTGTAGQCQCGNGRCQCPNGQCQCKAGQCRCGAEASSR